MSSTASSCAETILVGCPIHAYSGPKVFIISRSHEKHFDLFARYANFLESNFSDLL